MSEKWLKIGDLHAKKNNIEESEAIVDWCIAEAEKQNSNIIMLGDSLNDFGVLRVEMLLFFDRIIKKFDSFCERTRKIVVILKGNHDENAQATMTYLSLWSQRQSSVFIVTKPMQYGDILFVPFIRDHEVFKSTLNEHQSASVLVCHQEFDGCMYENGFYAPHGFKLDQLPSHIKTVVSGHIHKTQKIGSDNLWVHYIGIPRHLSKADIWHSPVIGMSSDFMNIEYLSVPEDVAPRFKVVSVNEETDKKTIESLMKVSERSRFYVEISGSKNFIKKLLKKHDWTGFKVKTIPTDEHQPSSTVKESEGIKKSFNSFLLSYADRNNLGQNEIKAIVGIYNELAPGFLS